MPSNFEVFLLFYFYLLSTFVLSLVFLHPNSCVLHLLVPVSSKHNDARKDRSAGQGNGQTSPQPKYGEIQWKPESGCEGKTNDIVGHKVVASPERLTPAASQHSATYRRDSIKDLKGSSEREDGCGESDRKGKRRSKNEKSGARWSRDLTQ